MVEMRLSRRSFFVRDFWGDPKHEGIRSTSSPASPTRGEKLKVTFTDGEEIVGATPNYDPQGIGFFIFSADLGSNTIKTFAVNASIRTIVNADEDAVRCPGVSEGRRGESPQRHQVTKRLDRGTRIQADPLPSGYRPL